MWHLAALVGRVLLAGIFLMSGVHKFTAWGETAQHMANEGIVAANIQLPIAAAVEIVGAVLLIVGFYTRLGAIALICFLIPTTLIFHDFWTYEGPAQQIEMINFMKNTSIMGGLFAVMGLGPGALSIDGGRTMAHAAGRV